MQEPVIGCAPPVPPVVPVVSDAAVARSIGAWPPVGTKPRSQERAAWNQDESMRTSEVRSIRGRAWATGTVTTIRARTTAATTTRREMKRNMANPSFNRSDRRARSRAVAKSQRLKEIDQVALLCLIV